MHLGLVLVPLLARPMASSCMPRIARLRSAPQQGHLDSRNSSIPRNFLPAVTNSGAEIILAGSTGLAVKIALKDRANPPHLSVCSKTKSVMWVS